MKICATILTGNRPDLLRRTLVASREVLERCGTVVIHNWSGDKETEAAALSYGGVVTTYGTGNRGSNGASTSACADLFLDKESDVWLHLEDDWFLDPALVAKLPNWLDLALEVVTNPEIGQVRLRDMDHLGTPIQSSQDISGQKPNFVFDDAERPEDQWHLEGGRKPASSRNFVTSQVVEWMTDVAWPFMVGPAHLTFNPFLMRRDVAEQVFWSPVTNELQAMERMHAARGPGNKRLLVAQMRPGFYRHIGEGRRVGQH